LKSHTSIEADKIINYFMVSCIRQLWCQCLSRVESRDALTALRHVQAVKV